MKNKIQLVDINLVSAYVGRYLTILVTVAVVAITVSAWRGLRVAHPVLFFAPGNEELAASVAAVLRDRGVDAAVAPVSSPAVDSAGLYLMATPEFLRRRATDGLEVVAVVESRDAGSDAAVVIARAGEAHLSGLASIADIVVADAASLNRSWVQLHELVRSGMPFGDSDRQRILSSARLHPDRVVYAVADGSASMGLCRMEDLRRVRKAGGVSDGEIVVISRTDCVPEWVLAFPQKRGEALVRGIASRIASEGKLGRSAVRLRPLREGEMQRADDVVRFSTAIRSDPLSP